MVIKLLISFPSEDSEDCNLKGEFHGLPAPRPPSRIDRRLSRRPQRHADPAPLAVRPGPGAAFQPGPSLPGIWAGATAIDRIERLRATLAEFNGFTLVID